MHELGIVFSVMDKVEKVAKENNIKEVSKVTLEIGEVSTIVPSYFLDLWKWAIKKSEIMKNCEANIIIIEGISYCTECKNTFKTTEFAKVCPYCKSDKTYLVTGSEVNIKDIEVID